VTGVPCVMSAVEHAGWAHVICVAAPDGVPAVVLRRRVMLIDAGLPPMPYEHDSVGLTEVDADALVDRVRRSATARAAIAMQRLAAELAPTYAAVALAIRKPPFPELPGSVRAVRNSYPLQCAADGMLYRSAICHAATKSGLEVHTYRRGDEIASAATGVGATARDVEQFVRVGGRPAGPPWTAEHRRAFAAGIAVLATYGHARRGLGTALRTPRSRPEPGHDR
jgi:hypothetical protein